MPSMKKVMSGRHKHRHGGKRIPNFVRPEERTEKRSRAVVWFASVGEAMASARGKR